MNDDLKLNVEGWQDDIKLLKEECDIDDEDEVQEVKAAGKPMKRKRLCMWHIIKDLQWKIGWKKSKLSFAEVIVAK